jgi:hypothetical protein
MFWFGKKSRRKSNQSARRKRPSSVRLSGWQPMLEPLEERALLTMLPPINYAAATAPTSVQIADINGDGKSDIVALTSSTNQVNVLLGNGDGTFQASVTSATAPFSSKLNVADYNHDGKPDIATNNTTSINIEFGNGDGSFQAPTPYYIGAAANDIETGDLNHDGFDDIVTASFSYGGTSQVLLNAGNGTFLPTSNTAISVFGRQVELADLNNDGNLDMVEGNDAYIVGVMFGRGDGTFQSMQVDNMGIATNDILLADLNHDGNTDATVTNGATLSVLLGTGAGTFQSATSYSANLASHLEAADFNGDGNLDILTNNGEIAFGRGDGTFYAPSPYSLAMGPSIGVGDFNGDGGADIVAAAPLGENIALNANNDAAALAGAVGLVVTAPSSATAGTSFAVTVSAVDANGNVVPGFLGTVGVTAVGGKTPVSYTFTAADNGSHTISGATTLFTAGTQSVTVTSPFLPSASTTLTITPSTAAKISVAGPATAMAGQPAAITVTALDLYGNVASSYSGSVHLTSSDGQAVLPADYAFTAADAGTHTFTATLKTAGPETVAASDTAPLSATGTSPAIFVTPAAATSLSLSGGGGFIGSPPAVTISARDAYGNVATGSNGVVHLAASDPTTTTSGDAALLNGVGTFTAMPTAIGTQTLTANDTSDATIIGSETITATAGWATRFVATPLAATAAGQTQMMTLTAYDGYGNVSDIYTGTIMVTSTDPQASGYYYAFTAAGKGVLTIPVTLKTAGMQSVTIADYMNPAANFSQTGIQVTPGAATSLSVTALHGTTAGVAQDLTVTARDAYGNVATGYAGTVALSSSDAQATFPATYTFTTADAGSHTFAVVFKTSGGQTFSLNDTANATNLAFTNFQRDIPITPAVAAAISIRAPSNVTAGVAFNITVSIVDAYGNVVPNYTGTIKFSGPSGGGNLLPANYTYTAADNGSHVFSVTLASTGTQTIGVSDTVNGSIKGQTSVKVVTSTTSTGGGGGGTATGGGGGGGTATGGGGGGGGKVKVV